MISLFLGSLLQFPPPVPDLSTCLYPLNDALQPEIQAQYIILSSVSLGHGIYQSNRKQLKMPRLQFPTAEIKGYVSASLVLYQFYFK